MDDAIRSRRPFEQFVLLAVVELAAHDETPAHSFEVTKRAKEHLDDVDRDPFGGVERQEVITALGALADDGLLSKERTESATGKGRPAYDLAVDPDVVIDALDDEPDVGPYAAELRPAV